MAALQNILNPVPAALDKQCLPVPAVAERCPPRRSPPPRRRRNPDFDFDTMMPVRLGSPEDRTPLPHSVRDPREPIHPLLTSRYQHQSSLPVQPPSASHFATEHPEDSRHMESRESPSAVEWREVLARNALPPSPYHLSQAGPGWSEDRRMMAQLRNNPRPSPYHLSRAETEYPEGRRHYDPTVNFSAAERGPSRNRTSSPSQYHFAPTPRDSHPPYSEYPQDNDYRGTYPPPQPSYTGHADPETRRQYDHESYGGPERRQSVVLPSPPHRTYYPPGADYGVPRHLPPLDHEHMHRPPYEDPTPTYRPSYDRQPPLDYVPAERTPYQPSDYTPADRPAYERQPLDYQPADRPPYEHQNWNRMPADRPYYERPQMDHTHLDRVPFPDIRRHDGPYGNLPLRPVEPPLMGMNHGMNGGIPSGMNGGISGPMNGIQNGVQNGSTNEESKPRKRRGNLPKPATDFMRAWLKDHLDHGYPNEEEKAMILRETGLRPNQVSNWYINARRRQLPKWLAQRDAREEAERKEAERRAAAGEPPAPSGLKRGHDDDSSDEDEVYTDCSDVDEDGEGSLSHEPQPRPVKKSRLSTSEEPEKASPEDGSKESPKEKRKPGPKRVPKCAGKSGCNGGPKGGPKGGGPKGGGGKGGCSKPSLNGGFGTCGY